MAHMRAELQIVWDGDGPGLSEHRLSVAALSKPLTLLLAAVRRLATNVMGEGPASERGARGGRFSRIAEAIDLQLSIVEPGCLCLSADIVFPEPEDFEDQRHLFPTDSNLADRTLVALIDAIDGESKGRPCNPAVRRYLRSLEGFATSHSYRAKIGDRLLAETRIGVPALVAEPTANSQMVAYQGRVSGLIFEPKPEIRLSHAGQRLRFSASAEQVERALDLRDHDVTVYAVRTNSGQLRVIDITLHEPAERRPRDRDERHQYLMRRWGNVLQRLSE